MHKSAHSTIYIRCRRELHPRPTRFVPDKASEGRSVKPNEGRWRSPPTLTLKGASAAVPFSSKAATSYHLYLLTGTWRKLVVCLLHTSSHQSTYQTPTGNRRLRPLFYIHTFELLTVSSIRVRTHQVVVYSLRTTISNTWYLVKFFWAIG